MKDFERLEKIRKLSAHHSGNYPLTVLDRYVNEWKGLQPFCYELEHRAERIYIGVVFGELLLFIAGKNIWDRDIYFGTSMPDEIRERADKIISDLHAELI